MNNLTILVNSCDAYEDLWMPFFTLLKKYLNPTEIPILLNTETKRFSFPGLNIQCANTAPDVPYGKRMLHAIKQIKTEYTLLLLDDFFLRSPADINKIEEILFWMSEDHNIVSFNFEGSKVYAEFEENKYPGFRRMPPGNKFTLNMQAAIWRTKDLRKYWKPNVSPWEWEIFCNALTTFYPKDKFYCAIGRSNQFLDYGHKEVSDLWGVIQGKWVTEDIAPLFQKEGIDVDLSIRGYYLYSYVRAVLPSSNTFCKQFNIVYRCLGLLIACKYFLFRVKIKICKLLRIPAEFDYFLFLENRAKHKFLSASSNNP